MLRGTMELACGFLVYGCLGKPAEASGSIAEPASMQQQPGQTLASVPYIPI